MITEENKQKVQEFYGKLIKVQPVSGHDIGMIVVKEENLGDIQAALPDPNNTSVYELDTQTPVSQTIKEILTALQNKQTILIQIHEFLSPEIYNQLYLIAQSGRADFFLPEGEMAFDVAKDAVLILISTDKELENLNYKNIFEVAGPVLRLE